MQLNNEQRRLFKRVMEKYGYNSTLWLADYDDTVFRNKHDMDVFLLQVFGIQGDFIFQYTSALRLVDAVINRYNMGQRTYRVTPERRQKLKEAFNTLKTWHKQ